MASQKELVAVVSREMGVSLETVKLIDRLLAEAGLRTRALRGRGHTAMTYQDAANLIIATALDANPKDAVRLVQTYGSLTPWRVKEDASIAYDALGPTFAIAVAEMVESVALERVDFSAPYDAPNHKSARVSMYGPTPRAEILLMLADEPKTFEFWGKTNERGDLKWTVEFTQITLGLVGEAIADDAPKNVSKK